MTVEHRFNTLCSIFRPAWGSRSAPEVQGSTHWQAFSISFFTFAANVYHKKSRRRIYTILSVQNLFDSINLLLARKKGVFTIW